MIGVAASFDLDRLPTDPSGIVDLRRRSSRDMAEAIVARAQHLAGSDRAIIELVYGEGKTAVEVAALRDECPRAVRRRLRSVVSRLQSPLFAFVVAERARFSPVRRRIATMCVLHGHSIRAAAERTGLSLHAVRTHMHAIRALFDAAQQRHPIHPSSPLPTSWPARPRTCGEG
jgi:DNA-directed RNA polymerase specialized sigma24 family protein